MSDLRIGLVAEGPTDFQVIEGALKAILRRPFVINLLQPEPTRPDLGCGWGGVFKWCREFRQRGAATIESDPTLSNFDMVIVHLDADVADKRYLDYGEAFGDVARNLMPLPCAQPCPPANNTVAALEAVLCSWMGIATTGPKSLFCVPSKAVESWLAAAVLADGHPLLAGIECRMDLDTQLASQPKATRIRKSVREYRSRTAEVTAQWGRVKARCTQAIEFEKRVCTAVESHGEGFASDLMSLR
ncbi:DUF4276 family protein [Pararobbsia alpina]|uniref:hypothetical protein n=1 Tax=Pararobbsia alpina TaxID=621374 RepID=UPI0039A68167